MKNKLVALCSSLLLSCPAFADFQVSYESTPIYGNTPEEIGNSIYQGRSRVALGTTTLAPISTEMIMLRSPSKCVVQNIVIKSSGLTVRLPELMNRGYVPQATVVGFDRFVASVRDHEMKHVAIWQDSFNDLSARLRKYEGADCDIARQQLSSESAAWRSYWEARQMDLDAREGHVSGDRVFSTLSSGHDMF